MTEDNGSCLENATEAIIFIVFGCCGTRHEHGHLIVLKRTVSLANSIGHLTGPSLCSGPAKVNN
jgi:hypothetical protein